MDQLGAHLFGTSLPAGSLLRTGFASISCFNFLLEKTLNRSLITANDMIPRIRLEDKIKEISERPWFPIEVARVNDQVVRMALCRGEFHWHKHTNEDELFYVLRGELTIQMRKPYSNTTLCQGELAVVPKNVEHCPKSQVETYVLVFEPLSLKSKGD